MALSSKPRFSRARFGAAALLGLVAVTVSGCILFSNFDGLEGGTTGSSAGSGGSGGSGADAGPDVEAGDGACSTATMPLCSTVPEAPEGFTQIVDGDPVEFCNLPVDTLKQVNLEFQNPCPNPPFSNQANVTAELRMVWDEKGVHGHARVTKNGALGFDDSGLYHSDAIEIFIANTDTPTGDLAVDHGVHLTLSPFGPDMMLPTGDAIVVERADGYDAEFFAPWSFLGGPNPPPKQSSILFDVVIDTSDGHGDHFSSALHYTNGEFCKHDGDPKVESDDHSWCQPLLKPRN